MIGTNFLYHLVCYQGWMKPTSYKHNLSCRLLPANYYLLVVMKLTNHKMLFLHLSLTF